MASPTTTSAPAQEAEQTTTPLTEPSMEDILASIRRIIAEDQSHGLSRGGLTGLTRRNQQPQEPQAVEPAVAVPAAAILREPLPPLAIEQEPELPVGSHADLLASSYEAGRLSDEPDAPVREETFPSMDPETYHPEPGTGHGFAPGESAFAAHLGDGLAPQDGETEPLMSASAGASITSSFQTLAESMVLQDPDLVERIMRETMRPLLKEWLDDHLPSIVERLVRTEIERVARGGRSRD